LVHNCAQILPVGGPGEAMDPVRQSEVLFKLIDKKPKTIKVPVALMDGIINSLALLGNVVPAMKEAAEFGRIGKYYATESMLVYDEKTGKYDAAATPSYGTETLEMFFKRVLKDGMQGQELGDQAVFGQK
jgi:divinyl chlorophyllide a 8-vinyl-reductase